ncbi:MAG: DMT family transporter, partial [Pseudomonadota bacterium]
MTDGGRADRRIGILAWLAAAGVGVTWQLATRFGVTTTLTPIDLALLRYVIPAVVLLPLLVRNGFWPTAGSPVLLPLIIVGAGLPFGLLGMAGAQFAPASHMGALLPGSMPVFVAVLSAIFLGECFTKIRLIGLGAVVSGVACVVGGTVSGSAGSPDVLVGDLLFLLAGVFWAVYTIAYRKSGLDPWHGAALICFWSALLVMPLWALSAEAKLAEALLPDIVMQMAAQGVLAGLMGLAAYAAAIRHLGASLG